MNKFINDTLKIRGKYSMKRVLVASTFPITIAIGIFIVISDKYLGVKVVNPYAIDVFRALLMFISVLVGINAYAKKAELKAIENIITDKETE